MSVLCGAGVRWRCGLVLAAGARKLNIVTFMVRGTELPNPGLVPRGRDSGVGARCC